MGRPQLPEDVRKTKPLLVYLTKGKKAKAAKLAAKAGISMGELFRRGVFGQSE